MKKSKCSLASSDANKAVRKKSQYTKLAESILLQPWFLPVRHVRAIHGLVPPGFWKKMRNVYDDYGCLICSSQSQYGSNGLCRKCDTKTRRKILLSARRHSRGNKQIRLDVELLRQQKIASQLLARFAPIRGKLPRDARFDPLRNTQSMRLWRSGKL
jgi:hypothetical protein